MARHAPSSSMVARVMPGRVCGSSWGNQRVTAVRCSISRPARLASSTMPCSSMSGATALTSARGRKVVSTLTAVLCSSIGRDRSQIPTSPGPNENGHAVEVAGVRAGDVELHDVVVAAVGGDHLRRAEHGLAAGLADVEGVGPQAQRGDVGGEARFGIARVERRQHLPAIVIVPLLGRNAPGAEIRPPQPKQCFGGRVQRFTHVASPKAQSRIYCVRQCGRSSHHATGESGVFL
jgi:hypothetical protein